MVSEVKAMLFTPIKPMLVSIGGQAFDHDNFIFEPKMDGWRILLHKQGDRIEAYTRNGKCVTGKFPELKEITSAIKPKTAILDSEGVVIREGRTIFDDFSFRGRLTDARKIAAAQVSHPASFVVFDVLATTQEHMSEPLTVRKQRLQEILDPHPSLMSTMFVEGEGKALSALSIKHNLEGIVAKRKDSTYKLGIRSEDWVKIKNYKEIDTVILGYRTIPEFSLVVGLNFPTVKNKPVATVHIGMSPEEKTAFLQIAQQILGKKDRNTQWIEPRICCRIEYLERTDLHYLRHVSFKEFLFDKRPEDCIWVS
ncbi:DNA ligase [Ammoniphilus sp. CFH 90114]|uniref:ATP-dependent DNA ligase n=1 Tax=Ammoniphilus sp. CFH 90114 TaxID=2493665 RepID=UPI00100FD84C|nr:DNA ligase [Ammoniphilus sp. CFH 90114]RXT06533.1 DNA ligase [Ammoniphilus sp. CFH 90114]